MVVGVGVKTATEDRLDAGGISLRPKVGGREECVMGNSLTCPSGIGWCQYSPPLMAKVVMIWLIVKDSQALWGTSLVDEV